MYIKKHVILGQLHLHECSLTEDKLLHVTYALALQMKHKRVALFLQFAYIQLLQKVGSNESTLYPAR